MDLRNVKGITKNKFQSLWIKDLYYMEFEYFKSTIFIYNIIKGCKQTKVDKKNSLFKIQ